MKTKHKYRKWMRDRERGTISQMLHGSVRLPTESYDRYCIRRKHERAILDARLKYGILYWDSQTYGQLKYKKEEN